MLAPPLPAETSTLFANSARIFLSAAAYAARHSLPEMLESIGFLTIFVTQWTQHQDIGLCQLYGHWEFLIENDDTYLVMTIAKEDIQKQTLEIQIFSDSDHASVFGRRSTGANATLFTGEGGSKGLVDFGSKVQHSVTRSSGEAETDILLANSANRVLANGDFFYLVCRRLLVRTRPSS